MTSSGPGCGAIRGTPRTSTPTTWQLQPPAKPRAPRVRSTPSFSPGSRPGKPRANSWVTTQIRPLRLWRREWRKERASLWPRRSDAHRIHPPTPARNLRTSAPYGRCKHLRLPEPSLEKSAVDLERFFRLLVQSLAATDPARLRGPIHLAEIRDSIVPYRASRRTLQIESSEDYELALMRLCAGEAGLARTEAAGRQAEFAAELGSANPDLSLVHQHGDTAIQLNPEAVARILDPKPDLRFAPRQPPLATDAKTPRKRARARPESPAVEQQVLTSCNRCRGALPAGRVVNFCPHCGQNLVRRHCSQCNTELEASWKHCVSCGTAVAGPRSSAS